MITKDTMVEVINKFGGTVGYDVPDLGVHRNFNPREKKEISFDELEKLSYIPGGKIILTDYLEIKNEEAIRKIFGKDFEPEYHYNDVDIVALMVKGSLDQFLDCLDFAPESVLETIKEVAVNLPLNDVSKRKAILEKLGFDVDKAIEIKNTKYDGGNENTSDKSTKAVRRTTPVKSLNASVPTPTGRRYKPDK